MAEIHFPVIAETDGFVAGMQKAVSAAQSEGGKLIKSAENIAAANDNASKKTLTLAQEYKAASKEAQKLAQVHGLNHAATIESAKRAAEYKDALDDVNDRINAFHPEKRFTLAAQGMGAALSVVQAGVGMFNALGLSSQSAEKAIVAMTAIQGMASALQNVEAMKGAYQAISVMVKTQVIPSILAMNATMMVGIGVLAVVIGSVIALGVHYSNAKDEAEKLLEAQEASKKDQEEHNKSVSKAISERFKTEDMEVRAMRDGYAKKHAEIMLNQRKELAAEKEIWEASNKTYFDKINAERRVAAIKANAANEVKKAQEEEAKRLESLNQITRIDKVKTTSTKSLAEIANEDLKNQTSLRPTKVQLPVQFEADPKYKEESLKNINNFFSEIKNELSVQKMSLVELASQVGQALSASIGGALGGIGAGVGEALANGKSTLEAIGNAIVKALAGLAIQVGTMLIAMATPMMLSAIPMGFVYAAAGTALIGLGAYANASIGGGGGGGMSSGGMSSGGSNPSTGWSGTGGPSTGFGSNTMGMNISGSSRISGRDLQLVYGREGYYSRRVGG